MLFGYACPTCGGQFGWVGNVGAFNALPKARMCNTCKKFVERLESPGQGEGETGAFDGVQFVPDHPEYFSIAMGCGPDLTHRLAGETYNDKGRILVKGRAHRKSLMRRLGMNDD